METIPAFNLVQNDRVVLYADEMSYLVDSVRDMDDGSVRVRYSSGDVRQYVANDEVSIVR